MRSSRQKRRSGRLRQNGPESRLSAVRPRPQSRRRGSPRGKRRRLCMARMAAKLDEESFQDQKWRKERAVQKSVAEAAVAAQLAIIIAKRAPARQGWGSRRHGPPQRLPRGQRSCSHRGSSSCPRRKPARGWKGRVKGAGIGNVSCLTHTHDNDNGNHHVTTCLAEFLFVTKSQSLTPSIESTSVEHPFGDRVRSISSNAKVQSR